MRQCSHRLIQIGTGSARDVVGPNDAVSVFVLCRERQHIAQGILIDPTIRPVHPESFLGGDVERATKITIGHRPVSVDALVVPEGPSEGLIQIVDGIPLILPNAVIGRPRTVKVGIGHEHVEAARTTIGTFRRREQSSNGPGGGTGTQNQNVAAFIGDGGGGGGVSVRRKQLLAPSVGSCRSAMTKFGTFRRRGHRHCMCMLAGNILRRSQRRRDKGMAGIGGRHRQHQGNHRRSPVEPHCLVLTLALLFFKQRC
mmetsp:Transcript_33159/g.97831  ORF Transcript_33159/g.97831 Transcript_33159/m.97831 type:complete len:255 (-) Transcript_33159:24-788(-)